MTGREQAVSQKYATEIILALRTDAADFFFQTGKKCATCISLK
jgi:hypothetical protein